MEAPLADPNCGEPARKLVNGRAGVEAGDEKFLVRNDNGESVFDAEVVPCFAE